MQRSSGSECNQKKLPEPSQRRGVFLAVRWKARSRAPGVERFDLRNAAQGRPSHHIHTHMRIAKSYYRGSEEPSGKTPMVNLRVTQERMKFLLEQARTIARSDCKPNVRAIDAAVGITYFPTQVCGLAPIARPDAITAR
jgi:hypothetical protein